MSKNNIKKLTSAQQDSLFSVLKVRFEKNKNRHAGLEWAKVQARLDSSAGREKLWSLSEMERTGGEPDVIGFDNKTDEYIFYDCSAESPNARRSLCYDREALDSRKENKPKDNALDMAAAMGIERFIRRTVQDIAETWKFRYENFELDKNACRYQKTRWCRLL